MKIANNCVVSIHYTLTNGEGEVLDSSAGGEPLSYLHGAGGIIPGLESELAGQSEGDELKVTVQPEDGYGDVNPELLQHVPRSAFEGVKELEPGMQFQAEGPEGEARIIMVQEVEDEQVLINANHPLAGQVLHFEVKVAAVREASAEELDHGHAH